MIVILGTSNTVGGQDEEHKNSEIMIHNLLSKQLGCEILNLSVPGRGTELYLENYIYACNEYNPKLFIAEIYIDRTYVNFWFPTKEIENLLLEGKIDEIYQSSLEKRYSWKEQEIDYRLQLSRINRITKNTIHLEKFQNCNIKWHSIEKLLEMYKTVSVYLDEDYLLALRSTKNLINLKKLSEITKIPVLFVSYGMPAIEFNESFVKNLNQDEYLNYFHNLPSGIIEWAEEKLKGKHFSFDNDHLNKTADQLSVDELFVPFIKNYIKKHNIKL
jgi:hypothetical protein